MITLNSKKDILLYGDSHLDRIKKKFVLEATSTLTNKIPRDSVDPFLN